MAIYCKRKLTRAQRKWMKDYESTTGFEALEWVLREVMQ